MIVLKDVGRVFNIYGQSDVDEEAGKWSDLERDRDRQFKEKINVN